MSTQLIIEGLSTPYYRHARAKSLLEALDKIALSNLYDGAAKSTTINFDGAFNGARQLEKNGERTQESVGKQSFDKLASAKAAFKDACLNCEFRRICGSKAQKEAIFWKLVGEPDNRTEAAKVRQRFRNRIKPNDVIRGLKTASCATLLQPTRIKLSQWIFSEEST